MLVLVATKELQGERPGDYDWTVEGELVTPVAAECASSERCGCTRGFPGLASDRATTTAMVVDRPGVTPLDLRDAVYDYLDRGGWIDLLAETEVERSGPDGVHDLDALVDAIIDEHVESVEQVCSSYTTGTVVSRRGSLIVARAPRQAA